MSGRNSRKAEETITNGKKTLQMAQQRVEDQRDTVGAQEQNEMGGQIKEKAGSPQNE